MHKSLDGRVGFLVERIEYQLRVVRHHDRLHGEKLANDGVVPWVPPIDPAQDVGAFKRQQARLYSPVRLVWGRLSRYPNCHGGSSHTVKDVLDELVATLHLCARFIVRHLLWNNGLQKSQEFGGALNRVCDLKFSPGISPCFTQGVIGERQYAKLTLQR
jgi:hypothetical protein